MVVEMTCNSARRDLVIPEYGRTIQEMVDHSEVHRRQGGTQQCCGSHCQRDGFRCRSRRGRG